MRPRQAFNAPGTICGQARCPLMAYLDRCGVPLHPDDLAAHECVNFRFNSSGQAFRWTFSAGDRTFERVPEGGVIADVSDAVAAIVASGGGIGISPSYVVAPYLRRGEVVPVLSDFMRPRSQITALWPESRRANPNVKAFVTYLNQIFPSPAPWDQIVAAHEAPRPPGDSRGR